MEKFKNIFRAGEPEETEEAGIVDEVRNNELKFFCIISSHVLCIPGPFYNQRTAR